MQIPHQIVWQNPSHLEDEVFPVVLVRRHGHHVLRVFGLAVGLRVTEAETRDVGPAALGGNLEVSFIQ